MAFSDGAKPASAKSIDRHWQLLLWLVDPARRRQLNGDFVHWRWRKYRLCVCVAKLDAVRLEHSNANVLMHSQVFWTRGGTSRNNITVNNAGTTGRY